MTTDTVLTDLSEGVFTVTLNRPAQRNAVNADLSVALGSALDAAEADRSVKVTVLKGAGSVFCSGMDLEAFQSGHGEEILFGPNGFAGIAKRRRKKPLIAAVRGAALAGGFEIMLACDLVIAAEGTVFGLPEPKLGLIAGAGGAMRLSRRVPRVLANELLLTGGRFDAQQMQAWGLVNRVVSADSLDAEAQTMALQIASNAAQSTMDTLRLADAAYHHQDNQLWELNDRLLRQRLQSEDADEGTKAFLQKRSPNWTA